MSDSSTTPLSFDLSLQEVPVQIGGVDYIIREATGEVAKNYRNSSIKSMIIAEEGSRFSGDGVAESEPLLVSLCLFRINTETGQPFPNNVGLKEVQSWPNRVIKPLFEKIKEISDLGEGDNTLEGLKKQRDKLTKQIEKMESDQELRKNS